MLSGPVRRDLLSQLNSALPQPGQSKMVAATTRGLDWESADSIADQDAPQACTALTPLPQERSSEYLAAPHSLPSIYGITAWDSNGQY